MTSPSPAACSPRSPSSSRPSSGSTTTSPSWASWSTRPEANVIKLPNVSASIPQLKATIEELRGKGYELPDYPDEPSTPAEEDIQARYDKVKGSAVNPVLREGNSDRRGPASVKNYARSHPHKMGAWAKDSKTSVATMGHDDFRSNEQSVTVAADDDLRVELVASDGAVTVLKESIPVLAGEIVDATFMSARNLDAFLAEQMAASQAQGVLFSIHLKATMMKVSDPIIFGHAVKTYFADVFSKYGDTFDRIGVNPNDGLADVLSRVAALPDAERAAIEGAITARLQDGPALAMVDSDRGITNLHVPSDIIIDASMPPMIRDSGQMWNRPAISRTRSRSFPTRATRVCTTRSCATARPTARSTRRRWVRCPTSASWRRRPRSTAPTTRRSRSRSTARCAS